MKSAFEMEHGVYTIPEKRPRVPRVSQSQPRSSLAIKDKDQFYAEKMGSSKSGESVSHKKRAQSYDVENENKVGELLMRL